MKIIYIANSTVPSRSANSIQVMKMCEAFAKRGVDIELLIPLSLKDLFSKIDLFNFYNIKKRFKIRKVLRLPGKGIALFYILAMLFSFFKKNYIVYTRQIEAAMLSSICHKKFILEMHSDLIDRVDRLFFSKISDSPYFLKLILISNYLKEIFLLHGFDEKKINVLPDAVDIVVFRNERTKKYKRIRIGYGGHLFRGRGIEIIEKLSMSMPDIDFFLWGGTNKLVSYWRKRTEKNKNMYFEGFINSAVLAENLANCDILIMPYQKEVAVYGNKGNTVNWMSPMKMFEYMATGRPIIASDLPAIREILKDKINAVLVSCDDAERWKEAIEWLNDNPKIAKMISENARNDIENNYTWDIRINEIISEL